MPWKVGDLVETRFDFVRRRRAGERMTDLCREFSISRKTGYKLWARYEALGVRGLADASRRPLRLARQTSEEVCELILKLKKKHPSWGAKKLKTVLERDKAGVRMPAQSTIGELLRRHGLVKPRRPHRGCTPTVGPLTPARSPNDVWGVDFKGQFRLGNQRYCYPLTLSDLCSRFILGCEALEQTKGHGAREACEVVFREYGLPAVMRSDNGTPFAAAGLAGLTKLSVWWMRLGIQLERIEPGHPEQNGRHERMHLTLKQETTRPPSENILAQQERFDYFRDEFNQQRPHEALGMRCPADIYTTSLRRFPDELPALHYPLHDDRRRVRPCGHLHLFKRNRQVYLSSALAGEFVGLRELDDRRWLVSFMDLDLGLVDVETCRLTPLPWDNSLTETDRPGAN
jgi:transposase InsO family protein